jgi:arylsulfatase A-like enzyme
VTTGRNAYPLRPTAISLAFSGLLAGCLLLGCGGPGREAYFDLAAELDAGLAVAGGGKRPPQAPAGEHTLVLPAGSEASFLLFLRPGSLMQAAEIEGTDGTEQVVVTIESDEEGRRRVGPLTAGAHPLELDLGIEVQTAARLTLSVPHGRGGQLLLRRPVLTAPASAEAREPAPVRAADRQPRRPDVVVYLVDTLRPDRLGCYGYERPISPNIDAFAAGADLHLNAIGQSSWTKASCGSIFTGVWPPGHGALSWKSRLDPTLATLPQLLQAGGYRTGAYVANPWIVEQWGFAAGFDDFLKRKLPSAGMNELVFGWLDTLDDERPFFLYVHTMDPHAPYRPPSPYRERFAPTADQMPSWQPRWKWPEEAKPFLSDLYDGEIAANDASFGALITELERRGRFEDAMIVFLSDHGEGFKEHGRWRHGSTLFGEMLNVPLIIKYPGQTEGRRIERPVQHVDLLPTILETVALPIPEQVEGRSVGVARGDGDERRQPIYSHLDLDRYRLHSVVDGDWKLIQGRILRKGKPTRYVRALFNWRRDPGELTNQWSARPILVEVLQHHLIHKLRTTREAASGQEVEIDPQLERELKALGYMQ